MKFSSYMVWLVVVLYWYIVTWDTPRGEWFDIYIPFLNWGAMAWIILAVMGFYYSTRVSFSGIKEKGTIWVSNITAIVSHQGVY